MEGVPQVEIPLARLEDGIDIVNFLAETKIFPSKGEARKTVQSGGVSINKEKVSDINFSIDTNVLLNKQYVLVQKGKKNYWLVKVD